MEMRRIHEEGECPDPIYGKECEGMASEMVDPVKKKETGEIETRLLCPGQYEGLRQSVL